ncbi:MAG: ATP-binding protein [Lachnospiraceae bacterium]|nr:ATP-binding protein [Lachnospiraceae bacterium]
MELVRKISKQIQSWYNNKDKKALLIKGARQVGKTHVIREFFENTECNFIEFNLIEQSEVIGVLQSFTTVNEMIMGLSTLTDKKFIKDDTIIFFDEIQKYKEMVTKIKFLVDEGSFRYILSGSLLGVEITNLESAPVGYMTSYAMFPLDFEEFLQITNISDDVIDHIKQSFKNRKPLMEVINQKLLSLFDQYLVVGGMPEAVSKFAETYNVNDVLKIHEDIIDLYKLDFTQYESVDKRLLLSNIYDIVPAELLKQNKRFIVSDIKKGLHFERVEDSFLWLDNAGVVLTVYNATEPRIPLKLNEKQSLFKLYLSDVGMLTSVYGMSTKTMLLSNDSKLNGGGIYENAVVCELVSKGFNVYYYNSKRNGELDFVIEYNGRLIPIEVKSGKDYKIHSALNNCIMKKYIIQRLTPTAKRLEIFIVWTVICQTVYQL